MYYENTPIEIETPSVNIALTSASSNRYLMVTTLYGRPFMYFADTASTPERTTAGNFGAKYGVAELVRAISGASAKGVGVPGWQGPVRVQLVATGVVRVTSNNFHIDLSLNDRKLMVQLLNALAV